VKTLFAYIVPFWLAFILFMLVVLNAFVWGFIGLYEAGRVIL
jgi:hypothetical protein